MHPIYTSILLAITILIGCDTPNSVAPQSVVADNPPKQIQGLPLSLSLKQRSTTRVPGTDDMLSITVDDITREQVMVTVLGKNEAAIAGPASLKVDDALLCSFDGTSYRVHVSELSNSLVGDDFATVVLDSSELAELTDDQTIDKLISAIAALEDATFIRNGQSHSAEDAAIHLRRKLNSASDRIQTAQEFIEHIASKSSLTGDEYLIRMADGDTIKAGDFLTRELAKLQKRR